MGCNSSRNAKGAVFSDASANSKAKPKVAQPKQNTAQAKQTASFPDSPVLLGQKENPDTSLEKEMLRGIELERREMEAERTEQVLERMPNMAANELVKVMADEISGQIQEIGCELLRKTASSSVQQQEELAAIGGVLAISSAMSRFPKSAQLQENGLWLLKEWASRPNHQAVLAHLGTMGTVVNAMFEHPDEARVQEYACTALLGMSVTFSLNRLKVVSLGGLKAITSAMSEHFAEEAVQAQACSALRALVCDITEQSQIDALEAVLRAMAAHPQGKDVQDQGVWAISRAFHSRQGSQVTFAFLRRGCAEAVLKAMLQHVDDASVQEHGCGALKSMSISNSENQASIGRLGVMEAVLNAMVAHPRSAAVQEQACWALRSFVADSAETAAKARALKCEDLVRKTMRDHDLAANVETAASAFLRELAENDIASC